MARVKKQVESITDVDTLIDDTIIYKQYYYKNGGVILYVNPKNGELIIEQGNTTIGISNNKALYMINSIYNDLSDYKEIITNSKAKSKSIWSRILKLI